MTSPTPDFRPRTGSAALEEALRTGPFHQALQLAIDASGLTLERLEVRLRQRGHDVSRSTLSYWQRGHRRPERPASLQALVVLEEILGLPESSLSALLGPRKPRGRWIGYENRDVDWSEMWAAKADVQRLTAIDNRRASERITEVLISERVTVGPDRRFTSERFEFVLRARRDNADRQFNLYSTDADTDVSKVRFEGVQGCRPGRRRALINDRLLAVEVLFDRTLAEGATHMYQYELDFSDAYLPDVPPEPSVEFGRAFRRAMPLYLLHVQFDTRALPVQCRHVRFPRLSATEQYVEDLLIGTDGAAHLAVQDVRPGVHAMRWEWE